MNANKFAKYAPAVVRVGIALVFLWFGIDQLRHASDWAMAVPEYAKILPFSSETIIMMHGLFEVIFGSLLLAGFKTRLASALLALNLAHITCLVGYNAIGVRDFGLFLATVSIFLNGADIATADSILEKKKLLANES